MKSTIFSLFVFMTLFSIGSLQAQCSGNPLQNPGFESGLANWDNWSNLALSNDAYAGSQALTISNTDGGGGQFATASAGTTYTVSAFAKVTGGFSGWAGIGMAFYDGSSTEIASYSQTISGGSYTSFSLTETAPTGTVSMSVWVVKNAGSGAILVDDFCLSDGSTGGGNPGGGTGTGSGVWTASGNNIYYNSGKVAIGTTDFAACLNDYKLLVDGNVVAEEVLVQLSEEWCDYVFAPDYNLQPLAEVAAYIDEHQHLPGIPSAAVVETEGLEVAEMTRLQMEKIEELTLYTIDQDQQIEDLKGQVADLQAQVKLLLTALQSNDQ